jgi:uncharacterized membrane protein YeaQ/YmgE (transglycosylase-associated protein family)
MSGFGNHIWRRTPNVASNESLLLVWYLSPSQRSDINAPRKEDNEMLSFIWWLIIGLIAGALARLIMPGRDPMGIIATILLGIVGSILGGLASWAIWGTQTEGFRPAGLLLSILGAIIVLWIYRMMKSRSTV